MDINNKFFEQVYVVMLLPLVCSVCGWLGNFLLAFSFFHLLRSSFHFKFVLGFSCISIIDQDGILPVQEA